MARREWPAWARASEILDLVRLSVPIAISRLAWMLMGLTDAIVLGQVAPDELPYILNAWLPIGVMLGFGMGILMGVQVLTAELGGRGQEADSGRIFRRGAVFALGLGIAMVAITYPTVESLFHWLFVTIAPPREAGDIPADLIVQEVSSATRILVLGMPGFLLGTVCSMYLEALRRPLLVTVVAYFMVAINLVFDLVLVAGWFGAPQLGADGVAIATTATRTASVFVFAVFIIWLTPGFRKSKPTPEGETRRQFEVGAGTAISNVAEWGGFNATYVIALWIAAHVNIIYGYASQLIGTAFMIFLGIGTATSVRVAEHVGRGNQLGVRESSHLGIAATVVSGIVLGAMILVFREQLASALVNRSAEVGGVLIWAGLVSVLWLAALATTFDGLQATASMALRAQGVIWLPTGIHIASFFALMLPMGYHLGLTLQRGAQGMLEGAAIALFVASMLQVLVLELKTARPSSPERAVS